MKKLPMITQRKKPDGRFFTLFGLVALMLAVSWWGQTAARQAAVTVPVERVPFVRPSPSAPAAAARETAAPQTAAPDAGQTAATLTELRHALDESRLASARMLGEVAESPETDAETAARAMAEKAALAVWMEQEAAVETVLAARGFGETLCTVREGSVNIVVGAQALSEADAAAILDVAVRETGADASQVRLSFR